MRTNGSTPARTGSADAPDHSVIAHLRRSEVFRHYRKAFEALTGLPVALRAAGSFEPLRDGALPANALSSRTFRPNRACTLHPQLEKPMTEGADFSSESAKSLELLDRPTAPIRVGSQVLGYLQTSPVGLQARTRFRQTGGPLTALDPAVGLQPVEAAFFQIRILTRRQYESVVSLLAIFGHHLALLSNHIILQSPATEAPVISRARAYIAEHQGESLTLRSVARAVHTSVYYFCTIFKRATNLTFTDYLARVRIESVKQLLLNRHKRVTEVAYAAGFQSISQFNRTFRRVAGETPSNYRRRLRPPIALACCSVGRPALPGSSGSPPEATVESGCRRRTQDFGVYSSR